MARKRAIDMLKDATKQHNQYLQRVKSGVGGNQSSNDHAHLPRVSAAEFFPENMSPTMVAPELPSRGASQLCDLALDALGLCDTCESDTRALTTIDVTHIDHGGADMLRCSSLLGTDETSWAAAGYDTPEDKKSRAVFRSFNPLHGVVHDTDRPAHKYVQSLGQPNIFV